MSDTSNANAVSADKVYDLRSSISPGDLGNIPAIIAATPEGSKEPVILGIIVGKVNALSFRDNPHGEEPSVALKGAFEFISADSAAINLRAPMLYLPQAVQSLFVAAVKAGNTEADITKKPARGKSIDVAGNEVEIMVQMGVRRHPSPIGYQYLAMMIDDAKKVDPLNEQRNKALAMFKRSPLQIAAQRLAITQEGSGTPAPQTPVEDAKPAPVVKPAATKKR